LHAAGAWRRAESVSENAMKTLSLAALLVAGVYAGSAFAQARAPRIPALDPAVEACKKNGESTIAAIKKTYLQTRANAFIAPKDLTAFSAIEIRLAGYAKVLENPRLTMEDCRAVESDVAGERANMSRLASAPASDNLVTACRTRNKDTVKEIALIMSKAKAEAGGKLSMKDERMFMGINKRTADYAKALDKSDLNLFTCQTLSSQIAAERDTVSRVIR
jgi:hypothetical protein